LFVHILFLVGFRNRILVMIQWAWSYLTYERGARLITGEARVVPVSSIEYAEEARSSRDALDGDVRELPPMGKRSA
jgi:NADH dehydrogenase